MSRLRGQGSAPGMTSSDVLDTCFAVQLARASDATAGRHRPAGGDRAARQNTQLRLASAQHAIHAEPIAWRQARQHFANSGTAPGWWRRAEDRHLRGTGAVGTFANVDPGVGRGSRQLGLAVERCKPGSSPATGTRCSLPPLRLLRPRWRRRQQIAPAAHRGAQAEEVLRAGAKTPRRCRISATRCWART